MEQLKHNLRILKRHQYWVLCGLVVVVGLVAWLLTVRSLASEQKAFQETIDSSYSAVQGVRSTANHQNREVQVKMEELIARRRQEVEEAWEKKYQQQNGGEDGETILKWPDELGEEFIQHVQQFRPIEKIAYPIVSPDRVIEVFMRENYRDYVKEELPKLAERIGSRWAPDLDGTGMFRMAEDSEPGQGGTTLDPDSSSVVLWNALDQQRIQMQHFDWSTGFGKTPTSLEVLYAQEDLWVLTALMDIVKRTNGNAKVRHNAAIKQIEFIKIGKSANFGRTGKVKAVVAPGTETEGSEEEYASDEYAEEYDASAVEDGSGDGEAPLRIDPAENRYVDKSYRPLIASTLRNAASSDNAEDAYLRVAKRMPIRMRVQMDQRSISRLLVECANADLTVEIRQVRINPQLVKTNRIGEMGSLNNFEPDFQRPGMNFGGGQFPGDPNALAASFPYDVTVEVYGIIYIYNPLDQTILGGEGDALAIGGSIAAMGG